MSLSLFGYDPKCRIEDNIGSVSNHAHTFGGDASDFELSFANAPLPLHLIYRIDLRDPLVPFSLPDSDFLPLLYCFNYGTDCCYLVNSNSEIILLHPGEQEHYWPPWEAPKTFLPQTTSFSSKKYDAKNADDVMDWKGIFGWEELGTKERNRALELAKELTHFSFEDYPKDDWTYETAVECMYEPPFVQGEPGNNCRNPNCKKSGCRVIALQHEPTTSELIWPDEYVQTIWQMCDSCHSICVTNQCT